MSSIVHTIKFVADAAKARQDIRQYGDEIVSAAQTVKRHEATLSGDKILKAAHDWTAAVAKLGGATKDAASSEQLLAGVAKMSATEKERVNRIVGEAIEKYRLLGQAAPSAMLALADATKRVEQPTSKLNGFFGDLGNQVKATALGFVGATAIIGGVQSAFRGMTAFVGGSIESFASAEAAQKKLTTALKQAGQTAPETGASMNALAGKYQALTTFSDDLITEMEALFVEVGQVGPAQMDAALQAATDLSVGLGIDLKQATMLVAKAFAGGGEELGRLKTILGDTYKEGSGMVGILDAINAKFGGQAQAEIETYAGKVKQLANEWDNLKEAVGEVILTDPLLNAALGKARDLVVGTNEAAGSGKRSLLEWWIALTGGTNSTVLNANLVLLQEYLRLMQSVPALRPPKAPQMFQAGAAPTVGLDWQQYLKDEEERLKKAEAAARKLREAQDALFGRDLIARANDYVKQLGPLSNLSQISEEKQRELNKAAGEAIDVYRRLHQTAPRAVRDLYMATFEAPPVVKGLTKEIWDMAEKIDVVIPKIYDYANALKYVNGDGSSGAKSIFTVGIPEIPAAARQAIEDLERLQERYDEFTNHIKYAGLRFANDIASAMADGIATGDWSQFENQFKAALANAMGEGVAAAVDMVVPGLGTALQPLFTALSDKLLGALGLGTKGRDLVKEFAASHGGFGALRKELESLGALGERLWINLTQGVGRNNPAEAQAAIKAINDALAHPPAGTQAAAAAAGYQTRAELVALAEQARKTYEYMRDSGLYTAAQIADAFKKSKDAQLAAIGESADAVSEKYKEAISKLDSEIQSLTQSIAQEAEEAEMGVIERQQRALLEAKKAEKAVKEAERDAELAAQQDQFDALYEAGKTVDQQLRDLFSRPLKIPYTFEAQNMPGGLPVYPQAEGGDFLVRKPTLFLAGEGGIERATFSGAGRTEHPTSGRSGTRVLQPVSVKIGARTLIETMIDVTHAEGLV